MDCTFQTPEGRFNYRATAVIVSGGNLLAMRDEFCTHYYLPGPESAPFSGEKDGRINTFFWLPFEELKNVELYPLFIQDRIFSLPDQLEIITEIEP